MIIIKSMLLGVNIDHIATLRNARGGVEPSVFEAAKLCETLKVNGITMHLREDRRHIKDEDVFLVKEKVNLKLNLEMAATQEMQNIILKLMPEACCIVPEKRQEVTTEGGLDVYSNFEYIKNFVKPLLTANIEVSLFIDPDEKQVKAAKDVGVNFIELHTGTYANTFGTSLENDSFNKLKKTAQLADSMGLYVNAGHGLNYENVLRMHEINCLNELNIGHSIISKAIFNGFESAVLEMKNLIQRK